MKPMGVASTFRPIARQCSRSACGRKWTEENLHAWRQYLLAI